MALKTRNPFDLMTFKAESNRKSSCGARKPFRYKVGFISCLLYKCSSVRLMITHECIVFLKAAIYHWDGRKKTSETGEGDLRKRLTNLIAMV